LLGYFYRLPRLPKLAGSAVLRQALVDGVAKGLFGLGNGSSWDADDAVLRFGQTLDPSEIQFQPGTWLVRGAAIKALMGERKHVEGEVPDTSDATIGNPANVDGTNEGIRRGGGNGPEDATPPPATGTLEAVTIAIRDIPGHRARDIVKVAVLPLTAVLACRRHPEFRRRLAALLRGPLDSIEGAMLEPVVAPG
jgi:hypothetical protein